MTAQAPDVATVTGPAADRGLPRLCFYSFNLVNLYRARPTGMVGGAEVQYQQIARQLAGDHDVHIVTLPPAEQDLVVPAGHTLHLVSAGRGAAGKGLAQRTGRFLARTMGFWRAFTKADAACYFERGAGFATFLTALHCRLHRRPFVFHWASDDDLHGRRMSEFPLLRPLFVLGRRMATVQVCQTEVQLGLLPPRQRRRAVVIPNLVDTSIPWQPGAGGDLVLWVGAVKPVAKRPDLLLDLAAALPHRRFRICGDLRGPPEFQAAFRERLATLANVEWTGFVERRDLPAHYAAARCLVNTSDFEGFPNTFLEACASGVPCVSLNVDPNGILAGGAGRFLAGDGARLASAVEELFTEPAWTKARAHCALVAAEHAPEASARRHREVLAGLGIGTRPAPAAAGDAATRVP